MKKPESPEEWKRWRDTVASEQQDAVRQDQTTKVQEAYTPTDAAEATAWNNLTKADMESEWESIRRFAMIRFPEGANYAGLSPKNRLVAIAHSFGWSHRKIAKAAGLSDSTVGAWLKRPEIKQFLNEFNVKVNQADPDQLWSDLAFKAMKIADDILSDPSTPKNLKLDCAKWVTERKYGKPNQPIEHKGASLKEVLQHISELRLEHSGPKDKDDECFDTKH